MAKLTKKMREAMNVFMLFCESQDLEYEHTEVLLRRVQKLKIDITPATLMQVWKEMLEEYYGDHPYDRPPDQLAKVADPLAEHKLAVAKMSAEEYKKRLASDEVFRNFRTEEYESGGSNPIRGQCRQKNENGNVRDAGARTHGGISNINA